MAVGIFQFGIDKSVAELSQQAGGERLLFPVFCLDDFRVVQQAERILPDNEADRVDPCCVLHQVEEIGIEEETLFR